MTSVMPFLFRGDFASGLHPAADRRMLAVDAMGQNDELIRKVVGSPREKLSVFEQVRRLNAELDRLGIKRPNDDHNVRRTVGAPRPISS